MDLFQQCESDFLRVVGLMKRHESSSGAGRRPDELLREAEELVARLRIEAGSLPGEEGKASLAKVRRYQEELASLQNVVKQTPNSYRQARRDLTGNPAGSSADAQRQKLLDSTSTLNKTGQRLTESRQLLAGMEEQGAAILQNLHSQRETIQRSQQRLQEADANISSSQKILNRMSRWLPF